MDNVRSVDLFGVLVCKAETQFPGYKATLVCNEEGEVLIVERDGEKDMAYRSRVSEHIPPVTLPGYKFSWATLSTFRFGGEFPTTEELRKWVWETSRFIELQLDFYRLPVH